MSTEVDLKDGDLGTGSSLGSATGSLLKGHLSSVPRGVAYHYYKLDYLNRRNFMSFPMHFC